MPTQRPEARFSWPFRKASPDGRWTVAATLEFDERGLRFTSLQISPVATKGPRPSLSSRVLRGLPLEKWATEFAAKKSRELQRAATFAPWAAMPILQGELAHAGKSPRGSSPLFYREVLQVYHQAQAGNLSPTKAVAEHFGTTPNLAATWVHRAKKLKLGMTAPGAISR
jgi:hypothetical protein